MHFVTSIWHLLFFSFSRFFSGHLFLRKSEPVTVHLDCNMTVDEVALGLALQWLTPFRFSCNRLLLQRLPEIHFPPYSLIRLFDPLVSATRRRIPFLNSAEVWLTFTILALKHSKLHERSILNVSFVRPVWFCVLSKWARLQGRWKCTALMLKLKS